MLTSCRASSRSTKRANSFCARSITAFAAILTFCCLTIVLTSCSKDDDNTIVAPQQKEYFTLWNQCEALTALQDYVKDVTDPASANFIPAEDRIATFDMDGTFVGELYPSYFEYNLLEYRALDDATYEAPKDVMETAQEIRDFVRNGKKLPDHFDMKHAYAADYCNRDWDFSYKIDHDDLCFRLFTEAGFEWGGDWTSCKDYQHFELIEE